MTMTQERIVTSADLFEFVRRERPELTAEDLSNYVSGAAGLLWLAAFIDLTDQMELGVTSPAPDVQSAFAQADLMVHSPLVERVSYNSPLEVVLSISTGAGAAIAIAHRMLALFERLQRAKTSRAAADMMVSAYHVISEEMRLDPAAPGLVYSATNLDEKSKAIFRNRVATAMVVLDKSSSIQVLSTPK